MLPLLFPVKSCCGLKARSPNFPKGGNCSTVDGRAFQLTCKKERIVINLKWYDTSVLTVLMESRLVWDVMPWSRGSLSSLWKPSVARELFQVQPWIRILRQSCSCVGLTYKTLASRQWSRSGSASSKPPVLRPCPPDLRPCEHLRASTLPAHVSCGQVHVPFKQVCALLSAYMYVCEHVSCASFHVQACARKPRASTWSRLQILWSSQAPFTSSLASLIVLWCGCIL